MAKFFINRPIVAMVISIVLIVLGLIVMKGLPISQFPDIVPPLIDVSTSYTGASSVDIEQTIATPLEQQLNGVENMIYMKSVNSNDGTVSIQVSFDIGSNLDNSNVLTQNRVSQATPFLPASVKNYGVSVKKSLTFPLLLIALKSKDGTYDNNFLSNYSAINIIDQLSRIKGVGDVKLMGGSDYAMRLWVKPDMLGKMGITVPDIINAVQEQNVITPAGQIGGQPAPPGTDFTYSVRTKGRLLNEEEFGSIIIRTNEDGSQLFLRDIARIELGSQLYSMTTRNDGKPTSLIAVYQSPGSNALEVAENVNKAIKELSVNFPPGITEETVLDTTLPIEEGINEIVHTLVEAIILVIIVVFIFLQNWKATLIPLITVPVSLISTFILFPILGFSINTLSLLGMVLAIGIVVDDAIVVVEAVMHHIEQGMSPKEATLKAMEEVTGPVIAIALILAAVFIPVAFMGGVTGKLYQQFAVTIAISVLFSAFNALTLSPALAAKLLKPQGAKKSPLQWFYNWFNKRFDKMKKGYLSFAAILIRKSIRGVLFIGIVIIVLFFLFKKVPGGFIPEEDNGYFIAVLQLPDASSLERTDNVSKKIEQILSEIKGIGSYTTVTGYNLMSGSSSSNTATFFISLKPWSERKEASLSSFSLIEQVNERLSTEVTEAIAYAFGPPAIQGLGNGSGFSFMLQDKSGNTPEALAQMTQKFVTEARKRPEIGSIMSLYQANVPQIYLEVNREKALKQGVDLSSISMTIGSLLGADYINDFNRFGRIYKVFLSSEDKYRNEISDIGQFFVKNKKGDMVPLNSLVDVKRITGPEFTTRFNLYRSAEITGSPAPGYSSEQTLSALKEVAAQTLPAGWGYDWSNMSYQEVKSAGSGASVFIFALFFVFLILAAQYESWSIPMSILLGTPFAIFGAMLGLWVSRFFSESYINNIYAQIGFITLIGLAAKNAILIVEFAKMKKERGEAVDTAALGAAELRLRPILMTSFAFILGVVPLVTAAGAGAEARKVMGMAVFSGLLIATILTVLIVPSLFVFIEKYFVRGKKENEKAFKLPSENKNTEGEKL
jgi:hydrophobic/amphiphilic exporter-1 (mainly G- bacteria), HAE1 family